MKTARYYKEILSHYSDGMLHAVLIIAAAVAAVAGIVSLW